MVIKNINVGGTVSLGGSPVQTTGPIAGYLGDSVSCQTLNANAAGKDLAIQGISGQNDGVRGISHSTANAGLSGRNDGPAPAPGASGGYALWGYSNNGAGLAVRGVLPSTIEGGLIVVKGATTCNGDHTTNGMTTMNGDSTTTGTSTTNGNHIVTGTVTAYDVILPGSDCAEHFDIASSAIAEPGTVMVINEGGELEPSACPYDTRVAGVISGAGAFRPGLILGQEESVKTRRPIALIGKVYCKIDAEFAPVSVGDLLTTSPTPGHAMKAIDARRAFGSVLGKAMQPLGSGRGLIPIIVALQ